MKVGARREGLEAALPLVWLVFRHSFYVVEITGILPFTLNFINM